MIEIFEVFDLPTEVLQHEKQQVKQLLASGVAGPERARLKQLRDTIQHELSERGSSQSLLQQLLPIIENSTPESWAAGPPPELLLAASSGASASLQQELLELVQAGQRIAAQKHSQAQPPQPQPPQRQQHEGSLHAGFQQGDQHTPFNPAISVGQPVSAAAHNAWLEQQAHEGSSASGGVGGAAAWLQQPTMLGGLEGSNGGTIPLRSSSKAGAGLYRSGSLSAQQQQQQQQLPSARVRPSSASSRPPSASAHIQRQQQQQQQQVTGSSRLTPPHQTSVRPNSTGMPRPAERVLSSGVKALHSNIPAQPHLERSNTAQGAQDGEGMQAEASGSYTHAGFDPEVEGLAEEWSEASSKGRSAGGSEGGKKNKASPPASTKPMSVLDAALQAFKEEQRMLNKARRAMHKGPKKAQPQQAALTRQELVAMYRGPPPAGATPHRHHHHQQQQQQQQRPQPQPHKPWCPASAAGVPTITNNTTNSSSSTTTRDKADNKAGQQLQLQRLPHEDVQRTVGDGGRAEDGKQGGVEEVAREVSEESSKNGGDDPSSQALSKASSPARSIRDEEAEGGLATTRPADASTLTGRAQSQNGRGAEGAQGGANRRLSSSSRGSSSSSSSSVHSSFCSTEYDSEGDEKAGTKGFDLNVSALSQLRQTHGSMIPGALQRACLRPQSPSACMQPDRWADWDLGDDQGVSAWGKTQLEDPLNGEVVEQQAILGQLASGGRGAKGEEAPPGVKVGPKRRVFAPPVDLTRVGVDAGGEGLAREGLRHGQGGPPSNEKGTSGGRASLHRPGRQGEGVGGDGRGVKAGSVSTDEALSVSSSSSSSGSSGGGGGGGRDAIGGSNSLGAFSAKHTEQGMERSGWGAQVAITNVSTPTGGAGGPQRIPIAGGAQPVQQPSRTVRPSSAQPGPSARALAPSSNETCGGGGGGGGAGRVVSSARAPVANPASAEDASRTAGELLRPRLQPFVRPEMQAQGGLSVGTSKPPSAAARRAAAATISSSCDSSSSSEVDVDAGSRPMRLSPLEQLALLQQQQQGQGQQQHLGQQQHQVQQQASLPQQQPVSSLQNHDHCNHQQQLPPPPPQQQQLSTPTLASKSDKPWEMYAAHFSGFHGILAMCYNAIYQIPDRPSSALALRPPPYSTSPFSASDITDKYRGLQLRAHAWLEALQQQQQKQQPKQAQSTQPSSSSATRFYTVADDTFHPEVRQALALALGPDTGWALDPIDQLTEPGRPNSDDPPSPPSSPSRASASATSAAASNSSANAGATAAGSAVSSNSGGGSVGPIQQRSPLAGRANMWNMLWAWSVKMRAPMGDLLSWQRVNHFPEAKQLTRKDLLKRHMVRHQIMHGSNSRVAHLFCCLPTTFVLPKEGPVFTEAFHKAAYGVECSVTQPKGLNLWIVKPVGQSRGRGIKLVRSARQLADSPGGFGTPDDSLVVQRYVTNPMMVQGYKFDLRLYVLVTSFTPLEAWLCQEGFARFATAPFTLDEAQLENRHMHLTNSSVQKSRVERGEVPDFLKKAHPAGGSKLSLTALQRLLELQQVDWSVLWEKIVEVVLACLFVVQDAIPSNPNAFELFGFDVLIDDHGCVWVLEVNSSPSFSLDTPLDRSIKPRMIRDAVAIVDPLPFDRAALQEVLAARTANKPRAARPGPRFMAGSAADERELMCADLEQILQKRVPRRYGETPDALKCGSCVSKGSRAGCCSNGGEGTADRNWYECIAPSPLLTKLSRLKKRS